MYTKIKKSDEDIEMELAELRKKAEPFDKLTKILFLTVFLGMLFILFIGLTDSENLIVYPIMIVVMVLMCITFIMSNMSRKIKRKMKAVLVENDFVTSAISSYFDVDIYNKNNHISKQDINNSKLMEKYSKIHGNDYVKGSYNGLNFEFSDIKLTKTVQDRSGDNNHNKTVTVFSGLWIICKLDYNLQTRISIKENIGGSIFNKNTLSSKAGLDEEFNNKYTVNAQDDTVASSILSAQFKKDILELREKISASIMIDFNEDKVSVAVYNGKDNFEIDLKETGGISSIKSKFQGDAKYVAEIIDVIQKNCIANKN